MILVRSTTNSARRRSAFTLLEILVVVAIILVLASVATVAVIQIQKDNKADIARIQAISLDKAVKLYMIKYDGNIPNSIEDVIPFIDGGDASKVTDPWGGTFQIGKVESGNSIHVYVHTVDPTNPSVEIRSDKKK